MHHHAIVSPQQQQGHDDNLPYQSQAHKPVWLDFTDENRRHRSLIYVFLGCLSHFHSKPVFWHSLITLERQGDNREVLTTTKLSPGDAGVFFSFCITNRSPNCCLFCWLPLRSSSSSRSPSLLFPFLLHSTTVVSTFFSLTAFTIYHAITASPVPFNRVFQGGNCFHLLPLSTLPTVLSPLPLLSPPLHSPARLLVSMYSVTPLAPALSAIRGPGERTLAQISIFWMGRV